MELELPKPVNPTMTFDEVFMERSKSFVKVLQDPEFSKFLESYENGLEKLRDEENGVPIVPKGELAVFEYGKQFMLRPAKYQSKRQ